MIVKEVLKTTKELGQHVVPSKEPHKELSSSVGVHNLTELRARLEERMLLTVHNENRTITANKEVWPSFNSTPNEEEYDEEISRGTF
jgi:hypothetical protein